MGGGDQAPPFPPPPHPLWAITNDHSRTSRLQNTRVTYIGSISVSGQLPTYSSLNPTLTLTCYQLTVVELGEG